MRFTRFVLLACLASLAFPTAAQVDLNRYLKEDAYGTIKISPDGTYYALTAPLEDRTVLLVLRRADHQFTAKVQGEKHSAIHDFWWISDERLAVSLAERIGSLERPLPTGKLHAINADGRNGRSLSGADAAGNSDATLSYGSPGFRAATMVDPLAGDDRNILISTQPHSYEPQTRIERLDTYTRRRTIVAAAPVKRATFTVDRAGVVRFALGAGDDNVSKLFYRDSRDEGWRLVNDEATSHRVEWPIGFSADGTSAYLLAQQPDGPDAIVEMDVATGARTDVLRDPVVDPFSIVRDDKVPIGASFMRDGVRTHYFDEKSPKARMLRSLERAFPGASVQFVSGTDDGRLNLVLVSSDRNPGDYYLYDRDTKEASLVFSRAAGFDPARMAATRAIEVEARDGLRLHGFLTVPAGSPGKSLPMVVMPHGGPFGVFDDWYFNREVQLLAEAGYAVLRINFRGSGNYGRTFLQAGAGEWGGRMQDDVTDATRWAIAEGVADPARICIYGASYGAFAALSGVAQEPELYRCAVGYVGVYDLALMHKEGSRKADWLETWADEWVGERSTLATRSPTAAAARIKVPVFLAAGGEDRVAPIEHSERMEKALEEAGGQVETLHYDTEGHGFYSSDHRREYYVRLLDFLASHIGGATAKQ